MAQQTLNNLESLLIQRNKINNNALDAISSGETTDQTLASNTDYAAGKGVSFAGGDVLDDYEEGTFTPVLEAGTVNFSSVTPDATFVGGIYTKIGDMVFISLSYRTNAVTIGSASGPITIGGLPFVVGDYVGQSENSAMKVSDTRDWAGNPLDGYAQGGTSSITLRTRVTFNGNAVGTQVSDVATGATSNIIRISGFYKV